MWELFGIILAGFMVGGTVGLTGMGGGALLTPIMVLFFGVNPMAAVGSDLAASVAMKPVGGLVHHRAGTVRWDIVAWLFPTAIPAGFFGAYLINLLGEGEELENRLKVVIGAALMLAVVGMIVRSVLIRRRGTGGSKEPVRVRPIPTLFIGLFGGLIVGMTSVGSGSLIMVMLMLAHPRLKANELVGTDLVQAVPLVAAAAIGHLVFGDTQLALAGTILLGGIPGMYFGARLSTKAPGDVLRSILAVVLVGTALTLWQVPIPIVLAVCGVLAAAGMTVLKMRRVRRQRARGKPSPAKRKPPVGAG